MCGLDVDATAILAFDHLTGRLWPWPKWSEFSIMGLLYLKDT